MAETKGIQGVIDIKAHKILERFMLEKDIKRKDKGIEQIILEFDKYLNK